MYAIFVKKKTKKKKEIIKSDTSFFSLFFYFFLCVFFIFYKKFNKPKIVLSKTRSLNEYIYLFSLVLFFKKNFFFYLILQLSKAIKTKNI